MSKKKHKAKRPQQQPAPEPEPQQREGARHDENAFVAPDIRPEDDPRIKMMDAIAGRRLEEDRGEFVPTDGDQLLEGQEWRPEAEAEPEAEPEETLEPEEQEEEQQTASGTEDGTEDDTEEEEEETVVLKIDGKEQRVPLSKVMDVGKRALQKDLSADQKLEQATRLLREAEERAKGQPSPPAPGDVDREAASTPDLDDKDRERIKRLSETIRYGEEEDADKAFEELVRMGRRNAATPEQIRQVLHQINRENITQRFHAPEDQGGFQDLTENPILMDFARHRVDQLVREGADGTSWETYQRAGEDTRAVKDALLNYVQTGRASSVSNREDLEARREKKRNMDVVRGVSQKKAPAPRAEDKEPQSPTDIIREMAKRRANPNVY